MKISTENRITRPPGVVLGYDPDATTEDVTDPTDRAAVSGVVTIPVSLQDEVSFVQSAVGTSSNVSGKVSATFATPPSEGSLLVAMVTIRSETTTPAVTGWTKVGDVNSTGGNNGVSAMYYRTAGAGESATITLTIGSNYKRLTVAEFAGPVTFADSTLEDEKAAATSYAVGGVTVGASVGLLVGVVHVSNEPLTFDAQELTEIAQGKCLSFSPTDVTGYLVTDSAATYTWTPTSGTNDTWAGILAAFDGTGGGLYWTVVDNVTDGDDTTFELPAEEAECLRIDLGIAYVIGSSRLRIGTETSGSKTYVLEGANAADYSDAVTLDSQTFTGTGSYTAQDVNYSWLPTTAYRYYRITGPAESRVFYTWELFDVVTDISGHVTDPTDAHDASAISYDNTSSGLTADDVQEAIDELAAGGAVSLALDDLTDVTITTPADGEVLTYDSGSGDWVNGAASGDTFGDLGWFNVEDYGAVHDGTTDDTTAIQDAIDACFAAGGGTIYFPANGATSPTIYQVDGALQDTGTYNSQLEIPQNSSGLLSMRFLGSTGVKLRSSWDGTISGTPSVISAGTHDSHTLNRVFIRFEKFRIEVHADPKLTAIDMTKAATCRWDGLSIAPYGTYTSSLPTHSNSVGLDLPWAINDQNSGGTEVYIDGFYTGIRPGEQMVADAIYTSYCKRAVEFRGSTGSPDYLAHACHIQRMNVWYCERGLVFTGDVRVVVIDLLDVEHNDPSPWTIVYDIDDASNYARGFIAWNTTDYTTGAPIDDLLVNGGTGLSRFGGYAKRWRMANVIDIPTGTNPATGPADGRRLYADSGTGHLTVIKPDNSTLDLESGTGSLALDDLTDVNAPSPGDGDLLSWDDGAGEWVSIAPPSGTIADGTTTGDILVWDGAAWAVLDVGSDDDILTVDSGETLGLRWGASSGFGYAPPTVTNWAGQFAGSATSVAVTVTAPTAGDNLLCVVYSTGRKPNAVPSQTNVTWTERYAGNGNGQYITVYTGVASASAGTTVTVNFTGSNNQFAEVFTVNSAPTFTAASAAQTNTAATTALATVAYAGFSAGDYVLLACCANAPSSSYGAVTHTTHPLNPTGGQGRGHFMRTNAKSVAWWSLSSSAVNHFTALVIVS